MPELTATTEVTVEFEVWCTKCGAGLCGETTVRRDAVSVNPCEDCLGEAREEGYSDGHDAGYVQAEKDHGL